MTCAWKELLMILPPWLRQDVDRLGKEDLQELRLRINAPPELVLGGGVKWLSRSATGDDLHFCVNAGSRYSPWAAETSARGYLTIPGGHRMGLCGEVAIHNGVISGIRTLHSLCIRVARDYPGIGNGIIASGSILILGAPGWGKTTLLRDIARNLAKTETVAVVDERGELYPEGVARGKRMDVLTGCPKHQGIEQVIRTMGPQWIVVDEITAQEDCEAIMRAIGCGVRFLASVHASSRQDFTGRVLYRPLIQLEEFNQLVVLNKRKQWHTERMNLCK